MGIRFRFIFTSVLFFLSCGDRKEEKIAEENQKETREVIEPLPKRVYNTVAISREFSDPSVRDKFSLELKGPTYREATIIFSITRNSGDTLFIRKVNGSDILNDQRKEKISSEGEREDFFLRYMSTFFAETSFSSPPYTLNDPQRDDFSGDLRLWEEIKDDTTAWCFEFSLSPGGKTEVIAYSKLSDSIIVYDTAP